MTYEYFQKVIDIEKCLNIHSFIFSEFSFFHSFIYGLIELEKLVMNIYFLISIRLLFDCRKGLKSRMAINVIYITTSNFFLQKLVDCKDIYFLKLVKNIIF